MPDKQEALPDRAADALLLDLAAVILGGHPVELNVLLQAALECSELSLGRPDVESAMNRLLAADLLDFDDDRVRPTETAKALRHPMRRAKTSNRLKRLEVALTEQPERLERARWHLDERRSEAVVAEHRAHQRNRLAARLEILEGLLEALDQMDAINAVVRSASNRNAAAAALQQAPFGFSEVQADHVLDVTVSRQTVAARSALGEEHARVKAALARLARDRS